MKCKTCENKISGRKRYCSNCVYERMKERRKRYYEENREKLLESNKIKEKKYMKNCLDCGATIYRGSLRCKSCASKIKTEKQKRIFKLKTAGKNNPNWKGGTKISRGYVLKLVKSHPNKNSDDYVQEHRLVVEKKIGRYLKKEEVVHHIDEDKSNNKIENLMLFSSQSKHVSFHSKIKQFGVTNPIKRQIKERWNNSSADRKARGIS